MGFAELKSAGSDLTERGEEGGAGRRGGGRGEGRGGGEGVPSPDAGDAQTFFPSAALAVAAAGVAVPPIARRRGWNSTCPSSCCSGGHDKVVFPPGLVAA